MQLLLNLLKWGIGPQNQVVGEQRRKQKPRTIFGSCFVGSSLHWPLRHFECSKHGIYIKLLPLISAALGSPSNSVGRVAVAGAAGTAGGQATRIVLSEEVSRKPATQFWLSPDRGPSH